MTEFLPDFVARFWSNVDRREPDECWNWTGDKFTAGYGRIYQNTGYKNGKQWGAHRISFALKHGHLAKFETCHSCDNPACVNPKHLFDGTHTDNMQDCKRKGRTRNGPFKQGDENFLRKYPEKVRRGEDNVNAILTEAIVRKIYKARMKGRTSIEIGEAMNLNPKTVLSVIQGFAWKHLIGVHGNPTLSELRQAGPGKERKLNAEKVASIRRMIGDGVPRRDICQRFNVSPSMLSLIHQKKAWAD